MFTADDKVLPLSPEGRIPAGRAARTDIPGAPHPLPQPGDGSPLTQVEWASASSVDGIVAAAVGAAPCWAETAPSVRATALRGIAAGLREHTDELAGLICAESGKRLAEAIGEVEGSAKYFDWFANAGEQPRDRHLANATRRFIVTHRPVGVVLAVSPWNFPLSIPARKVAPALAAGCPVIQKASELTPLTSMAMTLIAEQHLPPAVLGLLIGDGAELTSTLVDHPDVAAVTFTGSTRVGAQVAARAMSSMTRVTMELGGKSPFIICADADLDLAVDTLLIAKFRNNGASCIAANNVFVHASLYDQVRDAVADRVGTMAVGDPRDPGTDLGPLLRREHVSRLARLTSEAETAGCRTVTGNAGPNPDWYSPPVLLEASTDCQLWHEEIFGPVCALRSYTDEDAVVREVASWRTGLGGYLATRDFEHAASLAARLPVGLVGVNNGAPNTPEIPFGGVGFSGFGREGGEEGLLAFTEQQTVAFSR